MNRNWISFVREFDRTIPSLDEIANNGKVLAQAMRWAKRRKSLDEFSDKSIKGRRHKIVGSLQALFHWSNLFYVILGWNSQFQLRFESIIRKLFHLICWKTLFSPKGNIALMVLLSTIKSANRLCWIQCHLQLMSVFKFIALIARLFDKREMHLCRNGKSTLFHWSG